MGTFNLVKWFKEYGWRHLVGIVFVLFAIYPILFVITNSFADFANLANSKLIPDNFTLKHYKKLSGDSLVPYFRWLYNTYKVAIVASIFNVLLGTLAAYAFSRLQFKGRRASLLTLVIVQMFPAFLAFVAIYLLFFQISDILPFMGLGTHLGLILVYLGGSIGFNSWLIKGFMDTISPSLDEAAKVDGASDFQIFTKVIAPLARPILVVIFVITFIGIYSDYILAAIFLKDKNLWTVAVGINTVFVDDFNADWGVIAASSVLAAAPIATLFIFFQKQITGGLTAGSVKG
ncbi:MAG: sugar ABC transporter permease [Candidatus Actinomarina sp.]|jgi:arabinogalactan oligomer/maltooligosaccharide transport system permease protein|nr:sugar ABC transporter permease [Actinomycetota bacterium]MBL6833180.1 sugar ABC transporter permease [Candidatus Actinomarina sp.]MBL6837140.1 sugar ABC transporter permease [Candidatus Actinomarina sp.]